MGKSPFFGVYYNQAGQLVDLFTGQIVNPADLVPRMTPFYGVFLDAQGNPHDLSELGGGSGAATTAAQVSFANAGTGLAASSVQQALAEIMSAQITPLWEAENKLESSINGMLGLARTVYFNDQIQPTAAGVIDTGVILKDGANYQVIISAMGGNTGASASTGNGLTPAVNDGTNITNLVPPANFNGVLNAVYQFRWQMHPRVTQPEINVVNAFPLFGTNTMGSVYYTSSPNMDVDTAGISITYATQATTVQRLNISAAAQPSFALNVTANPTGTIRFMCKIIETQSAFPTN